MPGKLIRWMRISHASVSSSIADPNLAKLTRRKEGWQEATELVLWGRSVRIAWVLKTARLALANFICENCMGPQNGKRRCSEIHPAVAISVMLQNSTRNEHHKQRAGFMVSMSVRRTQICGALQPDIKFCVCQNWFSRTSIVGQEWFRQKKTNGTKMPHRQGILVKSLPLSLIKVSVCNSPPPHLSTPPCNQKTSFECRNIKRDHVCVGCLKPCVFPFSNVVWCFRSNICGSEHVLFPVMLSEPFYGGNNRKLRWWSCNQMLIQSTVSSSASYSNSALFATAAVEGEKSCDTVGNYHRNQINWGFVTG